MKMDIIWLGNPLAHDPCRVGGKTANLSRLAARYPVPLGFCLTPGDSHSLGEPSGEWIEPLSQAYLALGKHCHDFPPSVAVRSSAIDEDGRQASFAGQYESYLNIRGLEELLAAVLCCLDSACSERVRCYRQQQGLSTEAEIAVLVQQFIQADISAVVFSLDPASGARDRVVINAVWGLGERLVGGSVIPDLYAVRKSDGRLLESQIADKASMTIPALGSSGTCPVVVPRSLRHQPALDEVQIATLVQLACDLEVQMGWPVDVECSFVGEKLYLLQCRPVTTL